MKKTVSFKGVITALVTPFKNGEVDLQAFSRLLKFQIENGVHGLVVNGTTGESPTLHNDEIKQLFLAAAELAAGKIPVLVGTGSNSTEKTIKLTQLAAEWGASGALVVTPYYNKPPQAGLVAHFKAVAQAQPHLPIVLYNVPGRTSVDLSMASVLELLKVKNIVAIKEAKGDVGYALDLQKECQKIRADFVVTSGDDGTCMDFIAQGGDGVISVVSNILPEFVSHLYQKAQTDPSGATNEFAKTKELLRLLYIEANPIPVKMALSMMKIISSPEMRLPLVPLSSEHIQPLKNVLQEWNLLS